MLIGTLASAASDSSAAEIAHSLRALQSPLRVLYVAAHPDDENTQLLAWLARGLSVRAAYLSLTRGDGGQNLIGSEQRPLLGVIRTQELLAARRLDGAEQWFTRLRDFGYSKSAEESLKKWGEETALAEVVRVFRAFRPHVVMTRFPEEGETHGHHLASARLARQAFEASGDPARFADQLASGLQAWTPTRLYYNYPTFWARRGGEPPPGRRFDVDVGAYDPWLGASYGEISARSRSMHKSQGFGASARTGPWKETLILMAGTGPRTDSEDPFEGLETWDSIPGGAAFETAVAEALTDFDGAKPDAIIPQLGKAHQAAAGLQDPTLQKEMQGKIESLLIRAAGLLVEVRAETSEVPPGAACPVEARVLVRTEGVDVVLRGVSGPGFSTTPREILKPHTPWTREFEVRARAEAEPTRPHWLARAPEEALYPVEADERSLHPVASTPMKLTFGLGIGGVGLSLEQPIRRHWVDPVLGERTEPLEIAPTVSVNSEVDVLYAPRGRPQTLGFDVRAGSDGFVGRVSFDGEAEVEPTSARLSLAENESQRIRVEVRADKAGMLTARIHPKGRETEDAWNRVVIDHPHIGRTTMRARTSVRLVPVDLSLPQGPVGYIPGSGDRVAEILGRVGMEIELLDGRAIRSGDLGKYRAILVGIRAFNVNQDVLAARERLLKYVEDGGTLTVQYNTKNWQSKLPLEIGPYPMEISRGRVTDENSEVRFLSADHTLLKIPHAITTRDFEGWVQERGLYFAKSWDPRYTPLFSMNDPGEDALDGSTLVAQHGQGTFVFSGLSFFRQLPAGNPGALRLLVNLLSGGRSDATQGQVVH